MRCPLTETRSWWMKKWKIRTIRKLHDYLHRLRWHSTVENPCKNRDIPNTTDTVTALGNISRPVEDVDWVYVTLLDMVPSVDAEYDPRIPLHHERVEHKTGEEIQVQQPTTSELNQVFPVQSPATVNEGLNAQQPGSGALLERCTYPEKNIAMETKYSRTNSTGNTFSQSFGHQSNPQRHEAIHKRTDVAGKWFANSPTVRIGHRMVIFNTTQFVATTDGRDPSHQSMKWKFISILPREHPKMPSSSLRRPTSCDSAVQIKEDQMRHVVRRASTSDAHPKSYASNSTHCDAYCYSAASHSGFSGDLGRCWSFPTTMAALPSDEIERAYCPISPPEAPSKGHAPCSPFLESRNYPCEEDLLDRSSSLSSLSSIGTDIPYPDDFWTWSHESKKYFHIQTKPDGTEETIWYPEKFA